MQEELEPSTTAQLAIQAQEVQSERSQANITGQKRRSTVNLGRVVRAMRAASTPVTMNTHGAPTVAVAPESVDAAAVHEHSAVLADVEDLMREAPRVRRSTRLR